MQHLKASVDFSKARCCLARQCQARTRVTGSLVLPSVHGSSRKGTNTPSVASESPSLFLYKETLSKHLHELLLVDQ